MTYDYDERRTRRMMMKKTLKTPYRANLDLSYAAETEKNEKVPYVSDVFYNLNTENSANKYETQHVTNLD
jgi:hypothetical protein